MLGYFVVNHSVKLTPGQQFFYYIRLGYWDDALKMLERDVQLLTLHDDFPSTFRWTVLDHALGQARTDIIDILRNEYGISGRVHANLMNTFIYHQRWDLLFYALDHEFYAVNTLNMGYTLLDTVNYYHLSEAAALLRQNYDAKTANQLEENLISKKEIVKKLPTPKEQDTALMFNAAEYDDWAEVFSYLDKGCYVNAQHPSHDDKWVLLQYAFKHKNKDAFLALLIDHHADFDKIQFQSFEERIEYLTFKFDCLKVEGTQFSMPPLDLCESSMGIRWLHPENDPIEPFKNKTAMTVVNPIGHGRPRK